MSFNVSLAPRFGNYLSSYENGKPPQKSAYKKIKNTAKWAAIATGLGAFGYTSAAGIAAIGHHAHWWNANSTAFPWLDNQNTDSVNTANNDHAIDDLKKDLDAKNLVLSEKDNLIAQQKATIEDQKAGLAQKDIVIEKSHKAFQDFKDLVDKNLQELKKKLGDIKP